MLEFPWVLATTTCRGASTDRYTLCTGLLQTWISRAVFDAGISVGASNYNLSWC
jgi:hypothetical protein